jgi:DNA primase small subunit
MNNMQQPLPSSDLIQKMFGEYYRQADFPIKEPPRIEEREFGFLLYGGEMLRHKGFKRVYELQDFLRSFVPSNVYYSCAYYENPEAEMDKKGWLGADMVFDIDADHIPTSCNKLHDVWVCGNCGFTGKGVTPESCPVCSSQRFEGNTWPCEVCLESAKTETIKLLDMLMRDFGFSEKETRVFFSGHRGYHVHVESEAGKTLDAVARKEIVDYISGLGFDAIFHGLGETGVRMAHVLRGPTLNDSGWRGRIAKGVYDFILNADEEDFKSMGLKRNVIEAITKNKDMILKSWEDAGPWSAIKGVGFETWKKIAGFCAKSQSANVDTVVTTDIHRLIRLAGTLHGKTGLKKVEFPVSAIEGFDPFKSAVVFKRGTATVFVSDAPEFRLGDETFGPYKDRRVELPTAAALLLVCKGRAEVVE